MGLQKEVRWGWVFVLVRVFVFDPYGVVSGWLGHCLVQGPGIRERGGHHIMVI